MNNNNGISLLDQKFEYDSLSRENILDAVTHVDEQLNLNSIGKDRRLRYMLLCEELLLEYESIDENAGFVLIFKRTFIKLTVIIKVKSRKENILESSESSILRNILTELESEPQWSYKKGENIIKLFPLNYMFRKKNIQYFRNYMKGKRRLFAVASFLRFVNMGLIVLEPLLSAAIIVYFSGSEIQKILIIAAMIFGQAAASVLVTWGATRLLNKVYGTIKAEMQNSIVANVLRINSECMDKNGSGIFTQRILTDTENIIEGTDDLLGATTEVFRFISLMAAFLIISPVMFGLEFVMFLFYALIQNSHARRLAADKRALFTANEGRSGLINEMVRANRDIKLMHAEGSFLKKVKDKVDLSIGLNREMLRHSTNFLMLRGQFVAFTNLVYNCVLALMLAKGFLKPAAVLVLFNYNGKAYVSASSISGLIDTIHSISVSAERVYQLIGKKDFRQENFGSKSLKDVKGDIEIRNLSFSYTDENNVKSKVLEKIDIHIREGESVGLIGKSGCGKSTLLSLITKLYDPDNGVILLDGTDINELDRDTIRGNITMVNQMPYIFNMSIRENLKAVKADLTDEEMIRACKLACIHDDIEGFKDKYDTCVGEGGITLSGGQRQRLALARCLIMDHPVMILDEATSALDNDTQAKVMKNLEEFRGKKTLIMCAHRLSTVINCERLFYIADGKVLAEGTHEELLENCEEYRTLYGEETAAAS